ncbi:Impaired in baba-induced sterility [Thalictrum thalictroides]|uniref:Impaired in baba-induced sterility n=1 Tax=Thalictrum thalictroides TaxID=46969 RepID=A0A7J6X0R5_THATH|nr:Impaired in baba-induced sterility [Thalictrum thalictroides]
MGCISSKQAGSVTPAIEYSGAFRDNGSGILRSSLRNTAELEVNDKNTKKKKKRTSKSGSGENEFEESNRGSSYCGGDPISLRLGNLQKYVEGEQVAAGWPAWLSAVAGEAIQGWIPLRADSFEKLEKIGQGTYSSVFRARDLDTGKIVALKKVRFDNFDPESVRFMAREIMILRRLDHPNIVKLEGLITSRLSVSIYLVFEYMEHDLAGLSSCPDIKFTESQVKCYMQQLVSATEHCHSRGVMHRDIKGSNLLVNNEGILKMADFGLANFVSSGHRQPLTSRVVTLWYRPPELLLGSTDYGAAVDLWSVGCVFAELFLGKPILQGRTEVEQLHKIFKLCGSPPDEYWKKSKLPHATIFKPQHPYESSLHEICKSLPATALTLIQTLLSVEPYKRGSASSALASEYFRTKPYASDPATLPKYPPNKEIDAKSRDEARKKKNGGRTRGPEAIRKTTKASKILRESHEPRKLPAPMEEQVNGQLPPKPNLDKGDAVTRRIDQEPRKASMEMSHEGSHTKYASQGDIPFSGPLHVTTSSGFAWAKRRKEDAASIKSISRSSSRSQVSSALDPSNISDSKRRGNEEVDGIPRKSRGLDSRENYKRPMRNQWSQFERPDSFDASEMYHSQGLSEESDTKTYNLDYQDQGTMVEFSGPLLSQLGQSHKIDELLERHERHIRQAVRRSWFQRDRKNGK